MTRSDRNRLCDMAVHIRDIHSYTANGWDSFRADRAAQQAVMHCLAVIGECASRMTPGAAAHISSLTVTEAKGLRNIIVHEYWRVDSGDVWTTVTRDLPRLADDIRHVLDGMDRSLDL